jgi:hypothetical protein
MIQAKAVRRSLDEGGQRLGTRYGWQATLACDSREVGLIRHMLAATSMATNPYAPPNAVVADITPLDGRDEPPFFAVSMAKLILMLVCTFGLYQVYWFYKNWQRIAERERVSVWPLARAILAVFFCYPCFARMRDHESAGELGSQLYALPLAIGFIATSLTWRLPDPWGWISLSTSLFLLPAQRYVNKLNAVATPSHDRNSRLSGWNWAAVVFGGGFILLVITALFLDPEA